MPYFKDFTFEAGNELRRGSRAGSYASPLVPSDLVRHASRTSSPSFGPLDAMGQAIGGAGAGSGAGGAEGVLRAAPGRETSELGMMAGGSEGQTGVDDLVGMHLRPSPDLGPGSAPPGPPGASMLPPPAAAPGRSQPPPPPPVEREAEERPISPGLAAAMQNHPSGPARRQAGGLGSGTGRAAGTRAGGVRPAGGLASPLSSNGAAGTRVRARPQMPRSGVLRMGLRTSPGQGRGGAAPPSGGQSTLGSRGGGQRPGSRGLGGLAGVMGGNSRRAGSGGASRGGT